MIFYSPIINQFIRCFCGLQEDKDKPVFLYALCLQWHTFS